MQMHEYFSFDNIEKFLTVLDFLQKYRLSSVTFVHWTQHECVYWLSMEFNCWIGLKLMLCLSLSLLLPSASRGNNGNT